MKLTPNQVNSMSKGDPEIAGYFNGLLTFIEKQNEQIDKQAEQIEKQAKQIDKLEKRVHELERQLGQNSNNSSKPPSSDGFRKPTNLRSSGGKKGAPKGHGGTTLRIVDKPDEIIVHSLSTCSGCSASLKAVEIQDYEKRQVFDLPPPHIQVTEHRAEKKCCPQCGLQQSAAFPERITAPTQYGDGIAAWTAYLHAYQMLPLERISRLFADLTGYGPSEATLLSLLQTMCRSLEEAEQAIRTQLFRKAAVDADETGCRIEGKQTGFTSYPTRNGRCWAYMPSVEAKRWTTSRSSPFIQAPSSTTAIRRISKTSIPLIMRFAMRICSESAKGLPNMTVMNGRSK